MTNEIGNVFVKVKPCEQVFLFLKEQVKRHWPEAVFSTKPPVNGVSETLIYANQSAYKSWTTKGESTANQEKMISLTSIPDEMVLVMVPARHSKTEDFAWQLKEAAERRFPQFN